MSINELTALVTEYRELTRMQEDLTAELDAIKDKIKQHMTDAGTDEITGPTWKATYKPITSTRLDSTALKKEIPDIYTRYSKESTIKRLTIK